MTHIASRGKGVVPYDFSEVIGQVSISQLPKSWWFGFNLDKINSPFAAIKSSRVALIKHKSLHLMRFLLDIHAQVYQTFQREVDTIKQIAKSELLIYFSV